MDFEMPDRFAEINQVKTSLFFVVDTQTWMTYTWSLSWANVDKAFLVEQETKAGFWNKDIQVIYDSLFPDNPRAIRSLNMEDWDVFCSPWATHRSYEEVSSQNQLFLLI